MGMTSTRQDAWTEDEDLLLAEIVLRYIREGGTQLQAFEQVGKKVSRTAAACGFRWNSYVRKHYKKAIELAKKQRKKNFKQKSDHYPIKQTEQTTEDLTIEKVINYIQSLGETQAIHKQNENEKRKLQDELLDIKSQYRELQNKYKKIKKEHDQLIEDYSSMLVIMDKARKMAMKHENEDPQKEQLQFQMDKNGNLQRMKNKQ